MVRTGTPRYGEGSADLLGKVRKDPKGKAKGTQVHRNKKKAYDRSKEKFRGAYKDLAET